MCSLTLYCGCCGWETTTPFRIRHERRNFLKHGTRRHTRTNKISRADWCNFIGTLYHATQRSNSRDKIRHTEPWDFRVRMRFMSTISDIAYNKPGNEKMSRKRRRGYRICKAIRSLVFLFKIVVPYEAKQTSWRMGSHRQDTMPPGNLFERFREFLELISRFEFEFCRRDFFFEGFEFLVCSCECAVAFLCPRNSCKMYIYIYIYIYMRCSKKT